MAESTTRRCYLGITLQAATPFPSPCGQVALNVERNVRCYDPSVPHGLSINLIMCL